ncbi:MAG TPA: hypothetical protein VH639_13560 [Bryobacteraceae bacterium]|jgi:hypothetical protein
MGVYLRSIPFTASNTAACTIAAERGVSGAGVAGAVSVARSIV